MAAGGQSLAARSKKQNYNTHKRLLPHAKPALWGYMNEELQKLAAELKPQMVDFCQRLLRVPALSGEEKGVADLYLSEMEKLGYDKAFVIYDEQDQQSLIGHIIKLFLILDV